MGKMRDLFRNKTAIIIAAVALVLTAAVVTAALTGLFNGIGRSADTASGDIGTGTVTGSDGTVGKIRTAKPVETAVEISPMDQDSMGVDISSAFRLLFSEDVDKEAVASSLDVEPKQSFSLTEVSGREFRLEFDKPMKSDKVYNFTLNDRDNGARKSWAFQTKKQLTVVRTLPRDKGTSVPVNSGIEITFSHSGIENAEECFEISPKVEGRFEWNKKTLVFVPERLEHGTIYTVTIKKGVRVTGSDETLQDDYTFKFQTERPPTTKKYFDFSQGFYNFLPGTVPALEVYTMQEMAGSEVPVEIYRFPDAESFLDAVRKANRMPYWALWNKSESYDASTLEKLEKIASVNCTISDYGGDYYWTRYFLVLPSTLQDGYYLAAVDIDGDKYYVPVQINSTSVYIMTASNKCLAWLNDTVTGKPLSGAVFRHESGASAVSDSNGLAVFDAPRKDNDTPYDFFIAEHGSKLPFVACVSNYSSIYYWSSDTGFSATDNYWTYMYFDRSVYLPQDTVNVWGVVKPRSGAGIGNEAVLELVGYNWYMPGSSEPPVLASQDITLSPDGTFTGSFRISNYNPGGYSIRVRIGDNIMTSRYFSVQEYTKPVYTIDTVSDQKYMYEWETVNFDITSSFFEGTPVSGMKLDYTTLINYNIYNQGVLTCDSNGRASTSVKPVTDNKGWRPQTLEFRVINSEAEEQQIRESKYIYVFPRDTMVEVSSNVEDGKGTISFATSRIDLSKLKASGSGYPAVDDFRGESVDMQVTAKLYELYYEKVKTGSYYDNINKVRHDIYDYREVENLVNEYRFTTVDGKYEVQYASDRDKYYKLVINASDSQGRQIQETEWLYNWNAYDPYNTNKYVLSSGSSWKFRTGETVTSEVKYNGNEPYDGQNRRYLFVRLRNGIYDYTVSENSVYEFPFESSLIPNLYLKALCFDGTGIYNAGMNTYAFDSAEKKLDISITPDKQSYRPGEDVKLSVDVKDSAGNPASAEVNISIVDEAYFALYNQSADILSSLYGVYISSGFISEYLSYEPLPGFGGAGAEMGGEGGDDSIRRDFKDTALFTAVKTNADGKAEATFRMPDNLTSWRVTCQAVTSDLRAGTEVINVSSKLPFFVDSIFNKVFMTGDSPSILVRANGEELPEGVEVHFKVTVIPEEGTEKTYTAKGISKIHSEIQLEALDAGNYTIRIEGTYGSMKDAMERSFRVANSLLETSVTDFIPLTEDMSMATDARGLTTLTFFNEDSWTLYNELHSLYWTWGRRLDQVLARKISAKLLKNYFNEEWYQEDESDLGDYQLYDGGLALLTYDSSSPEFSAKMCSLAADSIDKGALAGYFYGLLENENTTPEDVIYAYWGLAALKEPVLLEIRSLLAVEDLDMRTRLTLGVALAEAGDYQGATQIYDEYMKSSATITDTYAWINAENRDDSVDATALCAVIAMKINAPEKMKLFNYISDNSTSMLLVNMERMMFVTNYIKDASLTGSFTYELDGVKKQITLDRGSCFRILLTPEKLSSIKFSGISGRIVAARSYTAPVSETMRDAGDIVSIKRTYETAGTKVPSTAFDRSETVKVTLTVQFSENAPDGYYEVTDILPAGFRYTQAYYVDQKIKEYEKWHYPSEVTGQKVVLGIYYGKSKESNERTISYFAKAVTPGTYTADNAAVRHTDNDIAGFSETDTITVRK
jgi:hypothetical protein